MVSKAQLSGVSGDELMEEEEGGTLGTEEDVREGM